MSFKLDARKAIEASATLLRLHRNRVMGKKRLLAMLYIADRESLHQTGRPIVGGRISALRYGPIHSEVYSLIQGSHSDEPQWSECFSNDIYFVVMDKDPGVSALSRYEVNLLNEITERYAGLDDFDIADLTHEFSEYKATYVPGTSRPIPFELLIDGAGRSEDKGDILKDAEEKAFLDKLFAET